MIKTDCWGHLGSGTQQIGVRPSLLIPGFVSLFFCFFFWEFLKFSYSSVSVLDSSSSSFTAKSGGRDCFSFSACSLWWPRSKGSAASNFKLHIFLISLVLPLGCEQEVLDVPSCVRHGHKVQEPGWNIHGRICVCDGVSSQAMLKPLFPGSHFWKPLFKAHYLQPQSTQVIEKMKTNST